MTALPPGFSSSGNVALDRRFRWAQASLAAGEATEACDILRQTTAEAPLWAPAWKLLGDALLRCADRGAAREAYEQTARLDPEGTLGARLDLSRLGAVAPANAMQAGYVSALFDDYADRFDTHLTQVLGYRGPQLVVAALRQACVAGGRDFRFRHGLDLGCGTGLMGEAIRPHVEELAGVDLSAGMIAKARAKLVYDRLAVGGLVEFLRDQPAGSLDLVLAADVLVYVGDLAPLFGAAVRAMCRGGLFAFTVQSCADDAAADGFRLGPDNRFTHSARHIRSIAASHGFAVSHLAPAVTRQDAGRDVAGFVVVLARSDHG